MTMTSRSISPCSLCPLILGIVVSGGVSLAAAVAEQPSEATSQPESSDETQAGDGQPDDAKRKANAAVDPEKVQPVATATASVSKPPALSKIALTAKSAQVEDKTLPAADESVLRKSKRFIGGIALVLEQQTELLFRARVDTGARSCSIHAEEFVIEDPAKSMQDNVGKVVRIKVKNHKEESGWVETRIDRLVHVKNSEHVEERYSAPMVFSCDDVEKEIRVTLNDRSEMAYPLLLGRNFLRGDFVVDVALTTKE